MAKRIQKTFDAAERSWTALNRAQRHVFDRIEQALKDAGLPSLAWYDVLLELWRAGDRPLRQVDLEGRLLFRQYSVSRLVDRLEAAGLVRRERSPTDARAHHLRPTSQGLALRERMWPVYAAAIAEHVGGRLDEAEADMLATFLAKLR